MEKFGKNPLVAPSGKNLSDAHGWCFPPTNVPPVYMMLLIRLSCIITVAVILQLKKHIQ